MYLTLYCSGVILGDDAKGVQIVFIKGILLMWIFPSKTLTWNSVGNGRWAFSEYDEQSNQVSTSIYRCNNQFYLSLVSIHVVMWCIKLDVQVNSGCMTYNKG